MTYLIRQRHSTGKITREEWCHDEQQCQRLANYAQAPVGPFTIMALLESGQRFSTKYSTYWLERKGKGQ